MVTRKSKITGYGMVTGIYGVLGLGVLLGILIGLPLRRIDGWQGSLSELAALLAAGIGLAYILLAIVDWVLQRRALAANPLPDELDLSERAIATEQLTALQGQSLLHRHIRRLLAAWAAGASGPQVATMAGNQMQRLLGTLVAETAAILVLLGATAGFMPPQVLLTLTSGLMALLVLVAVARIQLASHLAGYIESNLLARIGNDTPAAAGLEFAQAVAASVTASTESLEKAQTSFATQLVQIQEQSTAQLTKAQADAAAQMAKAQQDASAQLAQAQQDGNRQLAKAQDTIAEQLGRVTELASSIDAILKLQQAVDGTLKGVAVTDEFKSTLTALKQHLAESDELLKAAAKPRTIRLVEKDNE
ncbi:MAG: hypothetical protein PHI93_09615 [Kiritimatiellae bacterium]|nr:hypothetical protein [Kiritimatiellia bacterium]